MASGSRVLAERGVMSPVREARRLLELAAGASASLLTSGCRPSVGRRYQALLAARARRVPLTLLEGRTGFLDFDVAVQPGVFIPRPETEELAERAVAALRLLPAEAPRALDLGTGTGVLALALARARPDVRVVAVDASARALACARRNVKALGLGMRVEVRRSDWFSDVPGPFHLIVANPPYIARPDLTALEPEVRQYEPRRSLDGGPDGMSAIREILSGAPGHLVSGGTIFVEIGQDQGGDILKLAQANPFWVQTSVERDLAGKERFFIGRCG